MDYQHLAEQYRADLLTDLATLVAVNSTRDVAHATPAAPLGPGPAQALATMLGFAKRDGFTTANINHVAGRIEAGQGDTILGIFGHVDVVPAGSGWTSDPFTTTIQAGRVYGRGTADDKGPLLAAYYALRLLHDQGVTLHQRVHLIVGTDEESEWVGINRYLTTEPTPDYGFSPDAEFPIINGEKGIATFALTFHQPQLTPAPLVLTGFSAGLRVNMVPESATATMRGALPADFAQALGEFAAANDVTASLTSTGTDTVSVTLTGKGAHALEPKAGVNAATYLATFLTAYGFDAAGAQYLHAIATYLHNDSRGHQLGIAYTDKVMGELTASPDLFSYTPDGPQTIAINVRYPQGTDAATIRDQIETTLGAEHVTVAVAGHAQGPHYVAASDPLVQTLLQTYTDQTGLPGHEQVIGGGTYGRIIPRGVAFGAQPVGQENVMHQANEYMPINALIQAVAIYADAIARLAK